MEALFNPEHKPLYSIDAEAERYRDEDRTEGLEHEEEDDATPRRNSTQLIPLLPDAGERADDAGLIEQ